MSKSTFSFHSRRYFHLSLQGIAVGSLLTACSAQESDSFGEVELALTGSSRGTEYELTDAEFEIDGVISTTLSSNDDPSATISTPLPVGDYSVELKQGWRLLELGPEGGVEVEATLLSENPIDFAITSEETTVVRFLFETGDGTISFGEGTLDLGIEVEKRVRRELVFSELMKNPTILGDTDGEWLELTNSGSESVSLQGCVVSRDTTQIEIADALSVAPGQSVTLANSDAPGFTPNYVYSSLSLPNSAAFVLALSCAGELLDQVTVDPALTSNSAGASLNLDPAHLAADANDAPGAWCDASASYNGDLGTPGAANTPCAL